MDRQQDAFKGPATNSGGNEEQILTKETEKEWEREKSCGFRVGQEGKVGP